LADLDAFSGAWEDSVEGSSDSTGQWRNEAQFEGIPRWQGRAWNRGIDDVIPGFDLSKLGWFKSEASIVWWIDGVEAE
jgi:hypothetical protein